MAAELADDIDTAIALGTGDPSPYTGAQLLQHVDDLLARFHIDDVLADLDLRWTLQTACARLTDLPPLVWPCDGVPWRTWSVARSSSIGQR
jgi:hypothetical protein